MPTHVTFFDKLRGDKAGSVAFAHRAGDGLVASVKSLGRGAVHGLDLAPDNCLRRAVGARFEIMAQSRDDMSANVTIRRGCSPKEATVMLDR